MNVPVSTGYMASTMSVRMWCYIVSVMMTYCLGRRRYNIRIWKVFTDCFNCLPIAAVIDDKIFCCHGGMLLTVWSGWHLSFIGLSPDLQDFEQIRSIARPTDVPDTG